MSQSTSNSVRLVFFTILCCLPVSCQRKGGSDPRSADPDSSPCLTVDATRADLGPLEWDSKATATFNIRNSSARGIKLEVGAATCDCALCSLEQQELAPGQSTRFQITLNTKNRTGAGRVEACVQLGIKGQPEEFQFCATGYLEGVSSTLDYVIRGLHIAAKHLPPLRFGFVTRGPDAT